MATGEQFFYINNRIIDVRGLAVGAQVYFYLTGTTSLRTVYADVGLTTPLANPYTVAAGAAIPNIYLDPSITYRVRIIATTGQVIDDLDPYDPFDAASLTFIAEGVGATTTTVQAALRDLPLNPKLYGAIGDGQPHLLSSRFATLAAAQEEYPFATALTQSLDWAGIQAALNEAARDVNRRGTVRLPLGYYVLSNSLAIDNYVTFEGESQHGCWLFNQNVPLAAPQIVNANPVGCIFVVLRNLLLNGGTHGVKINVDDGAGGGEVADLLFENVNMLRQTDKCFEANKQVQTSRFMNCRFDGQNITAQGWRSNGGANNANMWIGCQFTGFTDANLVINTGSGNQFIACRFEGGGGTSFNGKRTVVFSAMVATSFYGCYFEATHEYLIESTGSDGSLMFIGCDFIGVVDSGDFRAYKWLTGSSPVTFSANSFFKDTTGPGVTVAVGSNPGLIVPNVVVSSAATITLPAGVSFATITGTTTITSVAVTAKDAGRIVVLGFAGSCSITDGGTLKLASTFAATADDTLTLLCDGTYWIEMCRSVN